MRVKTITYSRTLAVNGRKESFTLEVLLDEGESVQEAFAQVEKSIDHYVCQREQERADFDRATLVLSFPERYPDELAWAQEVANRHYNKPSVSGLEYSQLDTNQPIEGQESVIH